MRIYSVYIILFDNRKNGDKYQIYYECTNNNWTVGSIP
jgi:hypothetical protein